jgi:hypothetical protein
MKKMTQNILTCMLAFCLICTAVPVTTVNAAKKSTKKTVTTQAALNKALKNSSVTEIVFKTSKKMKVTIAASSDAKKKKLTINAAKATVTNKAVWGSIQIKNVSKYTESAKENSITVTDSNAKLVVAKNKSVKALTSKSKKLKLTVEANAKIKKFVNRKAYASIIISAAKGASVKGSLANAATVEKSGKGKVNLKEKTYSSNGLKTTLGNATVKYSGGKISLLKLSVKIPSPTAYDSALTYESSATDLTEDNKTTIYYKIGSGHDMASFREKYISALKKKGFQLAYEKSFGTSGGICYFTYTGKGSVDSPVKGNDGVYYPLSFKYSNNVGSTFSCYIQCAYQIGTTELFKEASKLESYTTKKNNMSYMGIYRDTQDYQTVALLNYNGQKLDNLSMMIPTTIAAKDVLSKSDINNLLLVDHGSSSGVIDDFSMKILKYNASELVFYLSYSVKNSSDATRYYTKALVAVDISDATVTDANADSSDADSSSGSSTALPTITTGSTCVTCGGSGKMTCPTCHGHIQISCKSCKGTGWVRMYGQTIQCTACGGTKTAICSKCTGGKVTCTACRGKGRIG